MLPGQASVIIVGGGPCGLMLANELGRRSISVLLLDQKPGTSPIPQANATQARTMEHYRRLGFVDEVRSLGMPPDFPTDIAYFTRFAKYELARYRLPSSRTAISMIKSLSGSWSAAELPHRVSQKFVEAVLRRHAERLPGVSVNYGWRMTRFRESADGVEMEAQPSAGGPSRTVRGGYLVGADGPRSMVRSQLGIRYGGETGVVRDFVGGRMYAVFCRVPDFYRAVPHPPAWMNVTFNRERRCFMPAIDGKSEFAFHTQMKSHEDENSVSQADAVRMVQAAIGAPLGVEVLSRDTWTAGRSPCATPPMPGALPTRSACTSRRLRSRTTRRRAKRRAGAPASTSRRMRVPNSTFPASPSADATTVRRRSFRTARRRLPTALTSTSRPPAPAAAHRICGSPTAARSTIASASSGRCCAWARSEAAGSSMPRGAGTSTSRSST